MKFSIFPALCLSAFLTIFAGTTHAALIVDFDLDGYTNQNPYTTPISTTTFGSTDVNLQDSSILFGSGVTTRDATNSSDRQLAAGFDGADVAAAIANNDYLSFNVTAASGYQFTVTGIDFEHRGNTGTNDFSAAVRSSVDSFASNLATFTIEQGELLTDNLTIAGIENQTSVEFRIYSWGAGAAADDFQFRNLDVNGTTAVIPEPSSVSLLLGCVALVVLFRRRRGC